MDIIIHINSVFRILNQLGIGIEGYRIEDANNTWSEFIGDGINLDDVKTYTYLKVRLIFDPPTNSFLVNAIEKQIDELTWRLNVEADKLETEDETDG